MDNTFNLASWQSWASFDPQAAATDIAAPLLIVHGDSAVSPESVREFISKVPRAVDQMWLPDVTQFDFYDRAVPMAAAADAATNHFRRAIDTR
jgi:fermentation-respiration switch protein FrsA (DUF1100 family)